MFGDIDFRTYCLNPEQNRADDSAFSRIYRGYPFGGVNAYPIPNDRFVSTSKHGKKSSNEDSLIKTAVGIALLVGAAILTRGKLRKIGGGSAKEGLRKLFKKYPRISKLFVRKPAPTVSWNFLQEFGGKI